MNGYTHKNRSSTIDTLVYVVHILIIQNPIRKKCIYQYCDWSLPCLIK